MKPIRLGAFVADVQIADAANSIVYRGRHEESNANVAIKILRDCDGMTQANERFQHEVRSTARILHPGIVRLYECGVVSSAQVESDQMHPWHGRAYLVTEWLDGGSLLNHLATLDWPRTKQLLTHLLDTLAVAHAHGLYHLDLKPGNIMMTHRGPVLVDFGIAQIIEDFTGDEKGPLVRGTPPFMAPEQTRARWRLFGPETDLYAVGCLAFCIISGRPPFYGESPWHIMHQHCTQPPPALRPRFDVPKGIEAWCHRLLQKKVEHRFRFACDARNALDSLASTDETDLYRVIETESARDIFALDEVDTMAAGAPPIFEAFSPEATIKTLPPTDEEWPEDDAEQEDIIDNDAAFPATWVIREHDALTAQPPGLGQSVFGIGRAQFCGRLRERDQLWEILAEVYDRRCVQVAIVKGPPGQGKSALIEWMASRAHTLGVSRFVYLTHQQHAGPFDGLTGMVRRYFRLHGLSSLERRSLIRQRLAVQDNDPVLDEMVALLEADSTYRRESGRNLTLTTPQQKYEAVARLLRLLSVDRPVILLAEDLHWSAQSIEFIDYMHRKHSGMRVCIFATVRSDEVVGIHRATMARIDSLAAGRRGRTLQLGPLARDDLAQLLQSRLRLETSTLNQLLNRAEGNPLHVEQLVQHLLAGGRLHHTLTGFAQKGSSARTMPLALENLWHRRLADALDYDTDAIHAIEVAAVLGRSVSVDEWKDVCHRINLAVDPTVLSRLEEAELLRLNGGQGRFDFEHALLVDSVLRRARADGRLERWHGACAAYMQAVTPVDFMRLAHHQEEAGQRDGAYESYLDAAMQARRLSEENDNHTAIEGAIRQLRAMGVTTRDRRWAKIRLAWAEIQLDKNQFDRAARHGRRALARFDADPISIEQADALGFMLNCTHRHRRTADALAEYLPRFLDTAEALQDPLTLMRAYWSIAQKYMKVGVPSGRTTMMNKLRVIFDASGHTIAASDRVRYELYLTHWQADQSAYRGDHEAAVQTGPKLLELAQRRGDRKGIAFANTTVGEFNRLAGHYDQAAKHYREARRLWLEVDDQTDVAIATMNLAMIRSSQGRFKLALSHWTDALDRLTQINAAMAARLRPAAMGVWAANGLWERWQDCIEDGIKFATTGDIGIDVLDAYADACALGHVSGAPPQNQLFARAIQTGLVALNTPELTEQTRRKLDDILQD
ncbi:MAG: protein kinase [Myxococcota bacterium]|nr:protein kinase [Myxococcota bacterium]